MMKQTESNYPSLSRLATEHGQAVPCSSNLPLTLDDSNMVWFIESGSVNLFLVEIRNGVEQSLRQHIMHCDTGAIIPGVITDNNLKTEGTRFTVIAKGIAGTALRRIPISYLERVAPAEIAVQIDSWVLSFTKTLSRFVTNLPRPTMLAEPDSKQQLEVGTISVRQRVVWIVGIPMGASLYMGIVDGFDTSATGITDPPMVPLTWASWLAVLQNTDVESKSTEEVIKQGLLPLALARFHELAFSLEHLNRRLALVDDTNLERIRNTSRNTAERVSRERLYNIYDLPVEQDLSDDETALFDALQIIGKYEKIAFQFPMRSGPSQKPVGLTAILDMSGIRSRRVNLKYDDHWWNTDGSAILAFLKENRQPVVLVPGLFGRYWMIDPVKKTKIRITANRTSLLQADAWMFYRPFPARKVTTTDMLRMALHRCSGNTIRLILAGIPGGLLQIIPALALGFTVSIVSTDRSEETLLTVSLVVVAFGLIAALLHILQKKSFMHLKDRATASIETAFWDRIISLPTHVLNFRSTSEIALSGMTFQHLRNSEQQTFVESLLSMIFMLPILLYICFIDIHLGLVTLTLCAISLLLSVLVGMLQIEPHGRAINAAQSALNKLFQIIEGIVKLRVERAEGSAYAIWAHDYRKQKRAEVDLGVLERHSRAFSTALPFFAGATLFFVVAIDDSHNTSIGNFLVVFIVLLTFLSVTTRFGESIGSLAVGLKGIGQLKPFLDAEPEVTVGRGPVEYLNGDVLFDRVSFRYDPDGPLILDDVTIHARPGEFIAIAGESGAGKSTLFNLALGINHPSSGAILYDGHDLRHLNLKQLRRNVGTVPQSIRLYPQDIWDNIVVYQEDITTEMVWDATQSAIIENQIKAMPMGLMTLVGTSGSVLSGGESQRISLARSLLRNPRVMLLDEATNWLDNNSQAEVMQNLALLVSTRIVIAHRLSTLEKADRIYVLKAGKVVQTGTYQDLRETEGVFKDLITRQNT